MTEERSNEELRCGYTVVDRDGIEQPCDRPASGWRWYQDCDHEDTLDVACDEHANEGGRRLAAAEREAAELRAHVVAERMAETAARISAASLVGYGEALDALMRAAGYVPAWDAAAAVPVSPQPEPPTERFTVEQIRDAYKRHSHPDDWGVACFYENGLLAALRGEFDRPGPLSEEGR